MGDQDSEITPEMEDALLAEDEDEQEAQPLDNMEDDDSDIIEIPDDSNSNPRFMTNGSGSGAEDEEEEDYSNSLDGDTEGQIHDSIQDIVDEDEDDDDVVELDQDEPSNLSSSYNKEFDDSLDIDENGHYIGSGEEDDDDVVPLDDEEQPSPTKRIPMSSQNPNPEGDDDDIMEIAEDDPLGGGGDGYYEDQDDDPINDDEESKAENSNEVEVQEESDSPTSNSKDPKRVDFNGIKISSSVTVSEVTSENVEGNTVINITTPTPDNNDKKDTESEGGTTNSSSSTGNSQKPTLVLIDTKSILSGKGPVPMNMKGTSGSSSGSNQVNCIKPIPKSDILLAPQRNPGPIKIPDDAFLIEAPSFIVPYVFEQTGEKALKEHLKELKAEIKKEKQEKAIANGELEPATEEDEDKDKENEKKQTKTEDYFESPVGKLLVNLGMSLVQEFVQVDLLKMQRRKADKERAKNRAGTCSMQTQQSIISLKNNVEDSKENNAPFHFPLQKCRQCNFRSESDLVMSTHLETPHMRNNFYRCNFCKETMKMPHEILIHMETEHKVRPRLERAPALHQCINCAYEDNSKAKITRHLIGCAKRFHIEKNLEPPSDWDTPAKLPKMPKNRLLAQGNFAMSGAAGAAGAYMNSPQLQQVQGRNVIVQYPTMKMNAGSYVQQGNRSMNLPPLLQAPKTKPLPGLIRTNPTTLQQQVSRMNNSIQKGMMMRGNAGPPIMNSHMVGNQLLQQVVNSQLNVPVMNNNIPGYLPKLGLSSNASALPNQRGASLIRNSNSNKSQPSISITPLPRNNPAPPSNAAASAKPPPGKTSFVICEICDGYIKDLDQLRNHMQWIHKVKIHPKMIYNKPPLNCQKCQFRFFTDQGLERHLLGSHGLVTSSMQEAANKGQDNGRCPLCGKVYQWKLLAHVAKDHNVTLKPAHLSYKCTVCTATFGMYKLFESHVYSAHSMNSKRNTNNGPAAGGMGRQVNTINNNQRMNQMQMKGFQSGQQQQQPSSYKPLKINDEITIIPQPMANAAPLRSKGSLTITPHNAPINRRMRVNGDDGGIEIIEIDDGSPRANGRKENGMEFRGQLPISASTLRKRNLEISVCDSDGSDDSFHRAAPPQKRLRGN